MRQLLSELYVDDTEDLQLTINKAVAMLERMEEVKWNGRLVILLLVEEKELNPLVGDTS